MTDAIALWIAAALSAPWCLVHLFIGGRQVAGPFRRSDLPPLVRAAAWLCWHLTSVTIMAMSACFAGAAMTGLPGHALAGTLLAAPFSAVGFLTPPIMGVSFLQAPQGFLILPIAVTGWWAL